MSNKESMVGQTVSLFLVGGWQVTGEVKSFDENKFVVEQGDELFLVFKDKVACLLLVDTSKSVGGEPPPRDRVVDGPTGLPPEAAAEGRASPFPMNSMSYEESWMSIPRDLLAGAPAPSADNDLSVFFSRNSGDGAPEASEGDEPSGKVMAGGISFGVEKDDPSN